MPTLLFNKPMGVLSQFLDADGRAGLGRWLDVPGVYAAGRLDADSEGLLVLTDDGALQARIASPRRHVIKVYLAQVEGVADDAACDRLTRGVTLRDGPAAARSAYVVAPPDWLWPRDPPVRVRRHIPTSWLRLELSEGRNRQVRRMTAAAGLPTLRLVRHAVGPWTLDGLAPGGWRELDNDAAWAALEPRGREARRTRGRRRSN